MRIKIYVLTVCSIGIVSAVLGMNTGELINNSDIERAAAQIMSLPAGYSSDFGSTLYFCSVYGVQLLPGKPCNDDVHRALAFFVLKTFGLQRPEGNFFGYCDAERGLFKAVCSWKDVAGGIARACEELGIPLIPYAALKDLVTPRCSSGLLADTLMVRGSYTETIAGSFMHDSKCYRLAAALYSIEGKNGVGKNTGQQYGLLVKHPQHLDKNFIAIEYSSIMKTFTMQSRMRSLGKDCRTDMGALILQKRVAAVSAPDKSDNDLIIHMLLHTYDSSSVFSRHKVEIVVGTIVTGAVAAAFIHRARVIPV